jgi:hypothetical protein
MKCSSRSGPSPVAARRLTFPENMRSRRLNEAAATCVYQARAMEAVVCGRPASHMTSS